MEAFDDSIPTIKLEEILDSYHILIVMDAGFCGSHRPILLFIS